MDKAPDFGSGDCRFESCHGRSLFSTDPWEKPLQSTWPKTRKLSEIMLERIRRALQIDFCWFGSPQIFM